LPPPDNSLEILRETLAGAGFFVSVLRRMTPPRAAPESAPQESTPAGGKGTPFRRGAPPPGGSAQGL